MFLQIIPFKSQHYYSLFLYLFHPFFFGCLVFFSFCIILLRKSIRLVHSLKFFQGGKSERYCCISSKQSNLIQILISSLCLLSSLSLRWCGECGSAGITVGPNLKDLFQLKQFDSILFWSSVPVSLREWRLSVVLLVQWVPTGVYHLKADTFYSWAVALVLHLKVQLS